jgi:hypothetical protein
MHDCSAGARQPEDMVDTVTGHTIKDARVPRRVEVPIRGGASPPNRVRRAETKKKTEVIIMNRLLECEKSWV